MADMTPVNISSVDLNLLTVVQAILQERSATRAAARLHVTQSAVSNSLRRARELFQDPLVVRTGRGFALTPRGDTLLPELQAILDGVARLLGQELSFHPESSTRRFTIACTDAIGAVMLPRLLPAFQARLPNAALRVVTIDRVVAAGFERGDFDLLVGMPPSVPAGCEAEVIGRDAMVAIVRADHPGVGRRLDLATYARLPHAELALFGEPESLVDRALAERGLRRCIRVTVPYLAAIPELVASSDLIATTVASMAERLAGPLGLRVLAPPVKLAPLEVRQVWHRRAARDPGSRLLRELVRAALGTPRGAKPRASRPGRAP
jgi:DNA-binding transcriptional LysR family regulator